MAENGSPLEVNSSIEQPQVENPIHLATRFFTASQERASHVIGLLEPARNGMEQIANKIGSFLTTAQSGDNSIMSHPEYPQNRADSFKATITAGAEVVAAKIRTGSKEALDLLPLVTKAPIEALGRFTGGVLERLTNLKLEIINRHYRAETMQTAASAFRQMASTKELSPQS